MKKVTIKDVAREAGVAVSTVSNALNGSELVTEDTRKKILEIAQKMNYVPNRNGKFLKMRSTHTLCFITSSISGEYFYKLIDTINNECNRIDYDLEIIISQSRETIMNHILGGRFDGYFLFVGGRVSDEELSLMQSGQISAVMLDRSYNSEKISSVVFDSFRAGYEVTKYLINLGHKRIGFMDAAADNYDCVQRKAGYKKALSDYRLSFCSEDVILGHFNEIMSYAAMLAQGQIFKKDLATAYVAGNDLSAIGTIKALQELGYRVPEQISVVGFDDIEIARYFTPALTTIKNPIEDQGRMAVELMMDLLHDLPGTNRMLSGNLVPRSSSGIVL